jgi:flagellar basal-body rod modification protein FlgD
MTTILNNIPVYDPTAKPAGIGSDMTSTKDLSQNFLRMLTTQLQNQDPMNPMDNAAMTSQLAQLNTVDGINRLNDAVSLMASQMAAANFMNLSNSVGKVALATGRTIAFMGQPISLAAKLDDPATSLTAVITDQVGRTIREIDLGGVPRGTTEFFWDGMHADGEMAFDGIYNLSLRAVDAQGKPVRADSYVGAYVSSVGLEGTEVRVGLVDGRNISSTEIFKWLAF